MIHNLPPALAPGVFLWLTLHIEMSSPASTLRELPEFVIERQVCAGVTWQLPDQTPM